MAFIEDEYYIIRKKMTVFIIVLIVVFALLELILWQNRALELNKLEIKSEKLPKAFDGYKILHISDLHNAEFGIKNRKLLALAEEACPDIIAITGDLIDRRRVNLQAAAELTENLVKIAPTYYVPGNHEARIDNYEAFKALLCSAGARVLDNKSEIITSGGDQIAVLGVNDPAFGADISVPEGEILDKFLAEAFSEGLRNHESSSENRNDARQDFCNAKSYGCETLHGDKSGFENRLPTEKASEHGVESDEKTTIYSVLLTHRPQFFDLYADHGANLTLAGHVHGGQFRLPFLGGIYAPEQGFLPDYDGGIYEKSGSVMIVSRGMGNSKFPIRINNRPEIILIELKTSSAND